MLNSKNSHITPTVIEKQNAKKATKYGDILMENLSLRLKRSISANVPIHVDVQSLVVNGETWNLGGYLDIGIVDTMKDLIVNFIGAVVFSIIGILYLRNRGKGKLAASLIPQVRSKQEEELSSKDQ